MTGVSSGMGAVGGTEPLPIGSELILGTWCQNSINCRTCSQCLQRIGELAGVGKPTLESIKAFSEY